MDAFILGAISLTSGCVIVALCVIGIASDRADDRRRGRHREPDE